MNGKIQCPGCDGSRIQFVGVTCPHCNGEGDVSHERALNYAGMLDRLADRDDDSARAGQLRERATQIRTDISESEAQ